MSPFISTHREAVHLLLQTEQAKEFEKLQKKLVADNEQEIQDGRTTQ